MPVKVFVFCWKADIFRALIMLCSTAFPTAVKRVDPRLRTRDSADEKAAQPCWSQEIQTHLIRRAAELTMQQTAQISISCSFAHPQEVNVPTASPSSLI
jgi:hypothetical protein